MKRVVKGTPSFLDSVEDNVIHVTMYLYPLIYADTEIYATGWIDKKAHTDINPSRIINGPLSGPGEELEPPLSDEWDGFIEDCKWLVEQLQFKVLDTNRSDTSKKSEYIIIYGIGDTPCGTLVFDLRISDHPFDATFPEELKDEVLEKLKMDKVLDGSATKAGIDFQVEKVTIGSVKNDSWDRAYNRLYEKLKSIRRKIRIRLNERNQ